VATSEQVRSTLTRALVAWSVASAAAAGLVLVAGRRSGRPDSRARRSPGGPSTWPSPGLSARPRDPVLDERAEATALRRLLLLNGALDLGYVTAGVLLWRAGRVRGRDSRGDGAGVVVQGAFLFVLDLVCAARLRTTPL
jgi:hypothetical protein